jgi:hypothetical protein
MATMKVKPWGEGQGDFVVIEEEDFNPDFHQKFSAAELKKLEAAPAEVPEEEPAADGGAVE